MITAAGLTFNTRSQTIYRYYSLRILVKFTICFPFFYDRGNESFQRCIGIWGYHSVLCYISCFGLFTIITSLLFFKCSHCLIVMITNASRNFFFGQYHLNGFQSTKPLKKSHYSKTVDRSFWRALNTGTCKTLGA